MCRVNIQHDTVKMALQVECKSRPATLPCEWCCFGLWTSPLCCSEHDVLLASPPPMHRTFSAADMNLTCRPRVECECVWFLYWTIGKKAVGRLTSQLHGRYQCDALHIPINLQSIEPPCLQLHALRQHFIWPSMTRAPLHPVKDDLSHASN